ncbi:class I SAM-dependent methyltransferase [Alteraurantiacibacter aestuarii]|uniref:Methyltransferase domain-containing protein n=1 Tax=Alteraurantiacibacter aestuarii TaxID=650004 RepID=A0A844ZTZ8_9SPHN|nr:class I SAM-dependent methyltransferase [Alteraurantiacibacter aestuarii]MXO89039.1 methyltransferase domain-containing protein [Alteraurantiacibacter aestuarii]
MSEQIDMAKVEAMAGKVIGDVAGAVSLFMAYMGDQAGVFEAMDGEGPMTCEQLAARTGMNAKYLHEWLGSIAAAGYVDFDPVAETFELTPEQALIFTREGQPACMQGFIQAIVAQYEMHAEAVETFKSGEGRPWSDHSQCLFCGTDRFFRPGYAANLVDSWIPALGGVKEKLEAGAKVADIGCGHGSSTVLMAKAFPNSTFHGFDFHAPSIEQARAQAAEAGVANVEFSVAKAQDYPGEDFDFACIFDALHDMGDPVGAARHIRDTLKDDGTFMLVEPMAGDSMGENMHVIGQIFYGFSCMVCTPASLAQDVGLGLGAQAGQKRLTQVLKEAGFNTVKRAAETPTNMVLEVTG